MKYTDNLLIGGPIFVAALLLIGWSYLGGLSTRGSAITELARISSTSDDDCAMCPKKDVESTCSVVGDYALGGVDVVQYFTDFKLSDGTYNESMVPSVGLDKFTSTYADFKFKFTTAHHQTLFEANPTHFIPQYGGFCGWGITAEFCPSYPWASDCMGPPGDVSHWTIVKGKLYLFYFDDVKVTFLEDVDNLISAGDSRWSEWFGDKAYLNTGCVFGVPI